MSTLQTTFLKHPDAADNQITFTSGGDVNFDNGAVYLDSTNNRLGVGITNPSAGLHVVNDVNPVLKLDRGSANTTNANLYYNGTLTGQVSAANADFQISAAGASTPLSFYVNGSERATLDTSGRLLVGTSSYSYAATAVLQGNSSASNEDAVIRMNRGGTPGANEDLGLITFGDNAGNVGASIRATNDTGSSWGSGDYPGRLTFSTTADQASSPTERMRIDSSGAISQLGEYRLYTALYTGDVTDNAQSGTATFDVTFNFADSNNFMIVEILGYHRAYSGLQEYYRFMASHRTVNNLYNHNILDDLTSTGSIAQTNTSVTFTGRRPRSNTGTSINSTIRVIYRGLLVPTSVTIANS